MTDETCKVYADANAPAGWGVQAVLSLDERVGWVMATGGDYYVKRGDRWVAVDLAGMLDHVVNVLGVVMVGRTISNAEYNRIVQAALADRNLPVKSGYVPGERKP